MVLKTGTQWIVFDGQTGKGTGSLYKPPHLDMEDCRASLAIAPGDIVLRIDGERADEAALNPIAVSANRYTLADVLAQYPEAVLTTIPALPTPRGGGRVTRYIPTYEAVVAQESMRDADGNDQLVWESAALALHLPVRAELAPLLPDRARLLGNRVRDVGTGAPS